MSRRLFLWQREVVEQREKVSDIRRKNEALVYNILPPHVAVHFLGKRKSDEASERERAKEQTEQKTLNFI